MGDPVLVVDDNAANRDLVAWLLGARGFEVRTAADGDEMLEVLASFRPGLILMDIQLPGVDGLELTRRLKASPATSGIPVVAVTAHAMKGDEARMRAAGCDGYLAKPIDVKTLPAFVARHVRRDPA
jgi:two-component system, cell cycle response regulator DivK